MRLKVCGIMNEESLDLCVQMGVNMVGFVVEYPRPVPWNLTTIEARQLIIKTPPMVSTCDVVGGEVDKVLDIAYKTRPHVVQLHYRETLSEVGEIAHRLRLNGIKTIKALSINEQGKCVFDIEDPILAAKELSKTEIDAILIDAYTADQPGGTGLRVDINTFLAIKRASSVPVILAGGLTAENIAEIIYASQPFAVDVLTGLEKKPGFKDEKQLRQFINNMG